MAALRLVALTLALCAIGVHGQANDPIFSDLAPTDLLFSYGPFATTATPKSALQQSNATSLNAAHANIVSRIFSIASCKSFVPHWHPGASEYFVGQTGVMTFNVLINGQLLRTNIGPGDAILAPTNAGHYFQNNGCEQANLVVTLTSAAPGFRGIYDPPKVITDGNFTADQFKEFIANGFVNSTLDQSRAFPDVTNGCQARCQAAQTAAPTPAPTPAPTRSPTRCPRCTCRVPPTPRPTKAPTRKRFFCYRGRRFIIWFGEVVRLRGTC